MGLKGTKYLVTAAMAVTVVAGACALNIGVTPGTLCDRLPEIETTADDVLTLTGAVNVTDLALLCKMSPAVRTLDLSTLFIAPYEYDDTGYMDRLKFEVYELVPNMLAGTEVTRVVLPPYNLTIGVQAFALSKIEEIEIPASVSGVGDYAFAGCENLKKVTFAGLPARLGKGMFRNCTNLQTVDFKQGLNHVPEGSFYGCTSLQAMPAGVETIGAEAFRNSGITVADLRDVTEVGAYAFADAGRLTTVLSDGPVRIGDGAFAGDAALEDLPELMSDVGQAMAAATGNALTQWLKSPIIGEAAFANNKNITVVKLGSKVREIKAHAFRNDSGIQTVNVAALGETVPVLDPDAFSGLEAEDGTYPIDLLVGEQHVNKWKEAEVWKKFNIRGTSAVDQVREPDYDVDIRREGETVTVTGAGPLDNVRVSGVSGVTYYDGGKGQTVITVTVPANEIAVVCARQGDRIKIVKLR